LQLGGKIAVFEQRTFLGIFAAVLAFGNPVYADEAAEKMVDEALPHMYHTCASVVEESDGDDDYVLDIVGKITALSLYNREIDITQYATSDEQKEELRETFLATLTAECGEDEDALLAGVIDDAVKTTLGL
jgi:hypothetical protein